MTQREFYELQRRQKVKKEWDDFRAAQIVSMVYNMNRAESADPTTPFDFMPSRVRARKAQQSDDDMMQIAKLWNAALGGEVRPCQSAEEN
jgi:hypothetical protein